MATKILIPAILSRYSPRADKSWSISLTLNEPSQEQKQVIDALFQQPCYVLIKEGEVTKEEQSLIDSLEAKEHKIKTKSQRLRNTLYRVWEEHFKDQMTDKEYYDKEMERIIDHYKGKLS
jgi:hypothetical protein